VPEAALQQLSGDAVVELLQADFKKSWPPNEWFPNHMRWGQLLRMPAAQQLSVGAVGELLQAAVEQRNSDAVRELVELVPAAQQLPVGAVGELLQAALK
jgi:hypothetical protein